MALVAARAHDREGEVDDHVGAGDELVDRGAVEHVAAQVASSCASPRPPGRARAAPSRGSRSTSRLRSSARMNARPMSPVGPVTATVTPARWRPLYPARAPAAAPRVVVARIAGQQHARDLALQHDARLDRHHLAPARVREQRVARAGSAASCSRCLIVGKTSCSSPAA